MDNGTHEIFKEVLSIATEQQADIATHATQLQFITEKMDTMYKALFQGNGQPSIKSTIQSMESDIKLTVDRSIKTLEALERLEQRLDNTDVVKIKETNSTKRKYIELGIAVISSGGIMAGLITWLKS